MTSTDRAQDDPARTAIVIVTFNAAFYVARCLLSLRKTRGVPFTTIVVDNHSRFPTRVVLRMLFRLGAINRLLFLDENTLFSPGCNLGVAIAPRDAGNVLLLNPDTVVRDPDWLAKLIDAHHAPGVVAYGRAHGGPVTRADGYCFLVDRATWDAVGGLDETYEWWWAITRFQAEVLGSHGPVIAIEHHDHLLHHFGGKSGKSWRGAKGMDTSHDEIASWFPDGPEVQVVDASSHQF